MQKWRPAVAAGATIALIVIVWAVWSGDVSEDQTNQISPEAAYEHIDPAPETVERPGDPESEVQSQ